MAVTLAQVVVPPPVPPRDAATAGHHGTAVIRGRVIAADTERPLRRAQIRATALDGTEPRTSTTNSQGVYELRDLPAGCYRVTASRSGYLPIDYGQRRPNEIAAPVEVSDGSVADGVDFHMPRGGVISGRVTDETGDVVAGIEVWPMQRRYYRGRRRLVRAGDSVRTDDTGLYRLVRLNPGEYIVMGVLRETWTTRGKEPVVLAYAPSYFPGTANAADAQRVSVALGQEVDGVDFSLVPGRAVRVSGTATRSDGTPLAGASINLSYRIMGPFGSAVGTIGSTRAAADGTWTLRDVAPGDYELTASGAPPDSGSRVMIPLAVRGVDLEGVALVAGASATISGKIVTDDGKPLKSGVSRVKIGAYNVSPDGPETFLATTDTNGLAGVDGTFEVKGVAPGPTIVQVLFPPQGWAVRRIDIGGRDWTDTPIVMANGDRIDGVRVILTDRLPALTGQIVNEKDERAQGTVLLFPTDATRWHEAARTVRAVRPDQSGVFRFDHVRAGEYFIIALDSVQDWRVNDPEFLAGLRQRAAKLTIGDEGSEPLVLKLVKEVQ